MTTKGHDGEITEQQQHETDESARVPARGEQEEGVGEDASSLLVDDDDDEHHHHRRPSTVPVSLQSTPITTSTTPGKILFNFVVMSILFASNHGCVVACLSIATARLGATGAWQSGIL